MVYRVREAMKAAGHLRPRSIARPKYGSEGRRSLYRTSSKSITPSPRRYGKELREYHDYKYAFIARGKINVRGRNTALFSS